MSKFTINSLMQVVLLATIVSLSNTLYSQSKVVEEILTDKLHNYSDVQRCEFISVPNKGVLVSYSIIEPKPGFSFGPSLVFYDKNLTKKWELKDYSNSELSKAWFAMYYGHAGNEFGRGKMGISECFVDPSGNYAYSVNFTTSKINQINIETGKLSVLSLNPKMRLMKQNGIPDYTMDGFIDKNYFYLVEGNNLDAKKDKTIYIRRIKHGETSAETFKLNLNLSDIDKKTYKKFILDMDKPSKEKSYENLLVTDNTFVLMATRTIINKKTKEFYRKFLVCPIDGSKSEEKMIKLGEEIADDDMLGDFMYDEVHKRIYTYNVSKDDGKLNYYYRCFDSKMNLIWEKKFDPKLSKQVVQKITHPATLHTSYDNNISITTRYGNKYYTLRTDKNGDNPEFAIDEKCTQGKLIDNDGYTLDCYEFNSLSKVKGFKSFIMKDKNDKENKFVDQTEFFVFDNTLIFAKSFWRKPGYKLISFDMP